MTEIVLIATRNLRLTVAIDEDNPRPCRVVFYDEKSKDRDHSAQEPSTSGVVVGGTEPGGDRAGWCLWSRYCDRRSSGSLFSTSGGNTDGTKEEGGKPPDPTTSTCRYDRSISSPLTSTSSGERPEGHSAWGCSHSCLCPGGGHRWIRSSPSRPRSFLRRLC